MDITDAVAIYAALMATAALSWEVVSHVSARKPRLRVDGSLLHVMHDEDDARALVQSMATNEWPEGMEWSLQLEVVNLGPVAVQIRRMYFLQRFEHGVRTWIVGPHGDDLVLDPGRARLFALTDDDKIEDFDPGKVMTAHVVLATGQTFDSPEFGHPVNKGTAVAMRAPVFDDLTERAGLADKVFRYEIHEPDPDPEAQGR